MRSTTKTITSLVLMLIFLAACFLGSIVMFMGIWLHTYSVFTQRTLVAEVSISKITSDAQGEYMDVTYTPYQQDSALVGLIVKNNGSSAVSTPVQFRIYGDTVHIGGPIVKFYDHLVLFNFQTIFKVGKIYGRYNLDNDKELNRKVISSYDLNGGIDPTWQSINDNINEWPYNMFVDTTQLSTPGVFGSKAKDQKYKFYMTVNGFLWEAI